MSFLQDEKAAAGGSLVETETRQAAESSPGRNNSEAQSVQGFRHKIRRLFLAYWEGRWSKRFLVGFWFPLATLFFVSGGVASTYFFEGPFDWRYRTLSTLSSRASNREGFTYCCFGLIVSFAMA